VIAGAVAAIVAMAITREPGPGLDPDSAAYLAAARSLTEGHGYRVPIVPWASADSTMPLAHFPPGYPTAIALTASLGMPAPQGARVVNAAAAFATVALATALTAAIAGELTALLLAIVLLLMPAFVDAHLRVLSEPLFLATLVATLTAMYAAAVARSETARLGWSLAGGCLAALALMVRYIGVAVCGASTLWSLFLPGSPRARVRRAALASVPWLTLSAVWTLHTHRAAGASAIRIIGTYGKIGDTFRNGVATIVALLVPLSPDDTLSGRRWIALALAVLLLLAMALGVRRVVHAQRESATAGAATPVWSGAMAVITPASLLAACYAAVLLGSRLFADPGIPFDERLLLPLFVLGGIVAAISIRIWWGGTRVPLRILGAALLVAWMLAAYHVSSDDVDWALENGYDLAGDPWRTSALMAWARVHAAGRTLYSNWPSVVVLQLDRSSHETPATRDTLVLRKFAAAVGGQQGIVLAFDTDAPDLIGVEPLLHVPGLRRIAQLPDGSVFTAAVPVAPTRLH
jgi:4-amino-4-deoxy-L-arabinose transferase-like glycosyltransferase